MILGTNEPDRPGFTGGCVWQWLEGTQVLMFTQMPFSRNVRNVLDSSALERYVTDEALILATPTMEAFGVDTYQPGDNSSAQGSANSGKAKAAAMRASLELRWAARDLCKVDSLVVAVHVKRHRVPEADWGTRNVAAWSPDGPPVPQELALQLGARFRAPMRVHILPPAPGWRARLTRLLRAVECEGTRRAFTLPLLVPLWGGPRGWSQAEPRQARAQVASDEGPAPAASAAS